MRNRRFWGACLVLLFFFTLNIQASFKEKVLPFMDKYCYSCHDSDTAKGDLDLESLKESPATDIQVAVWMEVMVHLREKTMPPPKKRKQPSEKERFEVKEFVEKAVNTSETQ